MHDGGNAAHHTTDAVRINSKREREHGGVAICGGCGCGGRFVHLREMPTLYTTHGVVADPARARCRVSRRVTSVNCGLVPAADACWRSGLLWHAQHTVVEHVESVEGFCRSFGPSRISATDENSWSTNALLLTVYYVNLAIELGFKRLGLHSASYIH